MQRKYQNIPAELFVQQRQRFMAQMPPQSIAIFYANDLMPRSGDTHFPLCQNADLFHLSGLDQEETVLVLFPNCPKGPDFQELVFTRRTNDYIRVWEGHKYTPDEVTKVSGVQTVFWTDDMDNILHELILLAKTILLNGNENDRAHHHVLDQNQRQTQKLQKQYPLHDFQRSQPLMKQLRMQKLPLEIAQMQQACNITEQAFRAVLQETKVGQMEYEVEALITYHFLRNGASGHAYTPIIASGANACILHYNDNCRPLNDGDMLLMDFGAEYAHYAADLSRTIPVNGRFSPRQKQVYQAVLRVKKAAEAMLLNGTLIEEYHREVGRIMELELIDLGLLDKHDVAKQNPKAPLYKRYFMHGTSHHLGLDVHDLADRYQTLKTGMVLTCEPGIYIPQEKLGIRLEDDILITETGNFNLMANIPIEAEAIETLMQERQLQTSV